MIKQKEITIYDIAEKLKISSATVSRALKDDPVVSKKTKKKIFELAEQMGYRANHFARNLRSQKTNTIGVIVPRLNSYFMSSVISGIEHEANREGYNLIISQSSESYDKELSNVKTMFNNRVDGLLVSLAYNTRNVDHFDFFFSKNIPLIFFDRVPDRKECTNVLIDNKKAAFEATAHLIEQGCQRICHITANITTNVYFDRLAGYKQALEAYNIPFNKDYIIINDLSQDAGVEAAEKLLELSPRPDGVFVANDNCAVGCMVALKSSGIKIPQDIAFVGFNNDPVSTVIEPNLTTINYPGYKVGVAAAKNLIDHLNGKTNIQITDTIILRSELIIRQSSLKKAR